MKALQIEDFEDFDRIYVEIDGMHCDYFDDNGGETEGNTLLILIESLPPKFPIEKFKVVEVNKIPLCEHNREMLEELNKNKKWCGWLSNKFAFVVTETRQNAPVLIQEKIEDGQNFEGKCRSFGGTDRATFAGKNKNIINVEDANAIAARDRNEIYGFNFNSTAARNDNKFYVGNANAIAARYKNELHAIDSNIIAAESENNITVVDDNRIICKHDNTIKLFGENNVVVAESGTKFIGKKGNLICMVEFEIDEEYDIKKIISFKAAMIDGETLKEDVFYTYENGEFVEAE